MFNARIPIQIPLDDKGYFDRCCPSERCGVRFKVLFEDWRDKVRDDVVYCPICRFEAESDHWNTPEQWEYIRDVAFRYVHDEVGRMMKETVRSFNRSVPKSGFITMSMSYKPGARPIVVPIEAADCLQQDFTCERCECRYSSLGAAFFCPACGHNSAVSTFEDAVRSVRAYIEHLAAIKEAVRSAAGEDAAENTERQIIESGLTKLVSSFQRLAEALFARLPNASQHNVRKNLFQNLDESSVTWRSATGKGYEDSLTVGELTELKHLFQQRHLLAHREGIVDQEYIERSGDINYRVGQRLIIRESGVLRLADLVSGLARGLKALVP
jgi:uncharacterized Zn finger protein (UPF0148 family)